MRRKLLLVAACGAIGLGVGSGQGAVSPPPGHSFGGKTSQGQLIAITLNPKRNKIAKIIWSWVAPCVAGPAATPTTDRGNLFSASSWNDIPINRHGAWRLARPAESTDAGGITSRYTDRVKGRRSGDRMIGTLRSTLTETDAAGQNVVTCISPLVHFNIANQGIFAGVTSQFLDPIVIRVSPARTRIAPFGWNWDGHCALGPAARPDTPPTSFTYPDFLRPIRIDKHGRFRGVQNFGPSADASSGIMRRWRYHFAGSLTRQLIHGTITASVTETDTASGGVIRICSSGPVKFHLSD